MGKAFKKEAKSVTDLLANLSLEDISKFESELESQGEFQLNDYCLVVDLPQGGFATNLPH